MSRIVSIDEFNSLKARVEALEAKIGSAFKEPPEEEMIKSKTAAFFSEKIGIAIGATIDPLDFLSDPTRMVLGREFSILDCPKACIPTKERIETPYGPLINFKMADEFQMYCRANSVEFKDGPYLDFSNPKYDVNLKYNHLTNWIFERLARPGADNPFYIDLVSNFLDENGKVISNKLMNPVGFIPMLHGMSEIVSKTSPDSSVGVSLEVPDFTNKTLPEKLRRACELIVSAKDAGVPINFLGVKLKIDVLQRIDPNVMAINFNYIDQTGINEIHITNILVTNKYGTADAFPSAVYDDLVASIANSESVSVLSFASPRTITGYQEGLFDEKMRRTSSYEAVRRGFWNIGG